MASSSSSPSSLSLAVQLEWYKIRDSLFGRNLENQNIALALRLAATCQHPDARWLAQVCAGKDLKVKPHVRELFAAQNDPRGACFAWMFGEFGGLSELRRAAELGFAFAQSELSNVTKNGERFKWAQLAAAQGERDGYYKLACCFQDGKGCEVDLEKCKENLLRASQLHHMFGMISLGECCSSVERWHWWGRAATLGWASSFLLSFSEPVRLLQAGELEHGAVVFVCGRALKNHIDCKQQTIFGSGWNFQERVDLALYAEAFYQLQLMSTRNAVNVWTLVGIRLKVVKDIRIMIAKMIWETREEGLYSLQ
jgi:hypothetical protein